MQYRFAVIYEPLRNILHKYHDKVGLGAGAGAGKMVRAAPCMLYHISYIETTVFSTIRGTRLKLI